MPKAPVVKPHSIKGAASGVGGQALSEIAYEIEKAAFRGKLDVAFEKIPELKKRFECLEKEMVADIPSGT